MKKINPLPNPDIPSNKPDEKFHLLNYLYNAILKNNPFAGTLLQFYVTFFAISTRYPKTFIIFLWISLIFDLFVIFIFTIFISTIVGALIFSFIRGLGVSSVFGKIFSMLIL